MNMTIPFLLSNGDSSLKMVSEIVLYNPTVYIYIFYIWYNIIILFIYIYTYTVNIYISLQRNLGGGGISPAIRPLDLL